MSLLFDHNLSAQLIERLADLFPGCAHTGAAGLARAQDLEVWHYARGRGLAIVTKDSDFHHLSLLRGFPPKVVWIRTGNCSTRRIEEILRREHWTIVAFLTSKEEALLALV